jgi:hypothetical protein
MSDGALPAYRACLRETQLWDVPNPPDEFGQRTRIRCNLGLKGSGCNSHAAVPDKDVGAAA